MPPERETLPFREPGATLEAAPLNATAAVLLHGPEPTGVPLRVKAILMLLIANFLWGLSFPLVKSVLLLNEKLLPHVGTWFSTISTVTPRFCLALLVLLAIRPRALFGVRRGEWIQGGAIGLFATGGMLFQNDGLQFTAASTSAFLTQLYAILIPVFLAVRERRNPGARVWVSGVLVLAGVAILGNFDWHQMRLGRGEWETLLCSVFFMGQILWLDKKEFAGNRAFELTLVIFATHALCFAGLTALTAPNVEALLLPWRSPVWLSLTAILTLLCTLGAFGLMNAWQPKITATEAGLIYCVEPVFGSLMALFLPALVSRWAGIDYANETATWTLLVGGGLITAANVLIQLRKS